MLMLAVALLLGQNPLDALVNRNRVLLIFAPRSGDVRLEQQRKLLKGHAVEIKDRDLLVVPVFAESGIAQDASTLAEMVPRFNTPEDQQALRTRFRVGPSEFAVVLVGKDGGEKLRSASPVSAQTIKKTIDAMPMRQDEMKGRRSGDTPPSR